jgi:hypothetical protein
MIECSIAWFVRGANRKVRYLGTQRNRLWLAHRVAARARAERLAYHRNRDNQNRP